MAIVRGSWLVEAQLACPAGREKIKSAALYSCEFHSGVISLGSMKTCSESCLSCLAWPNSSNAYLAAAGGGVQVSVPFE